MKDYLRNLAMFAGLILAMAAAFAILHFGFDVPSDKVGGLLALIFGITWAVHLLTLSARRDRPAR